MVSLVVVIIGVIVIHNIDYEIHSRWKETKKTENMVGILFTVTSWWWLCWTRPENVPNYADESIGGWYLVFTWCFQR